MKRFLIGIFAALISAAALGTTLNPIQLLNPVGSSSGQAIVSTGASTAPAWGGVGVNSIAAIAANTVLANATGSSAAPTAFAMPSCTGSTNALGYTSGTGIICNGSINAATLGGATFASPPAAGYGSATPEPVAATTLSASGNDALFYQTANAQSFTSGTAATVTTWTKIFDRLNANFAASTGIFTAPVTGIYHVVTQIDFASNTGAVGTLCQINIIANGVAVANGNYFRQTATATQMACSVFADVSLTAGQTIIIQGFQNTGGAVTLNGLGTANFLSIHRVP